MKILIPTLNASAQLPKLLQKLQAYKDNILIIDSSSNDNTVQLAKDFGVTVHEIHRKEFNHATTRNIALNYDADFYLFMTQDVIPYDEQLIDNLLKPFLDEDVVVAYARQIPHEDADPIEKFARETNYPSHSMVKTKENLKDLGIKTFFCSNSCAMYRASYFKEQGGFTEGVIMNEDMEFAARVILDDKKIAYAANAKVWHSHRYGVSALFKRYFDIGIFFKTNPWIFKEVEKYNSAESTGIKQAKAELVYLLKNSPLSVPKSILFSFIKYLAYKLGCHYDKLPFRIKKACSLHKNFHT